MMQFKINSNSKKNSKFLFQIFSLVDANSCQTTICQSNTDCKAFIYDNTESESGCHIFQQNLNWESCMEVGADINDDIDTCQNGEGCDVSNIYHCISIRI